MIILQMKPTKRIWFQVSALKSIRIKNFLIKRLLTRPGNGMEKNGMPGDFATMTYIVFIQRMLLNNVLILE